MLQNHTFLLLNLFAKFKTYFRLLKLGQLSWPRYEPPSCVPESKLVHHSLLKIGILRSFQALGEFSPSELTKLGQNLSCGR